MTNRQRRRWWLDLYRENLWLFQFGQANDSAAHDGKDACGHVSIQGLVKGWKDKRVTINEVDKAAGSPPAGLTTSGALKALKAFGLPYAHVLDPDPLDLVRIARTKGPVLFLGAYSHWPEWKGYVYFGHQADGRPNGFARPLGEAGKNQVVGFDGGHYGTLVSSRITSSRTDCFLHDTNHNSTSRPEKPPFDIVTRRQFVVLLESFRRVPGMSGDTHAFIPTEVFDV